MKFTSLFKAAASAPKTLSFRDFEVDEEAVVSGLRSERLIFEPGETNSILEVAKKKTTPFDKECVVLDSFDPVLDFRVSMEEMVAAYAVKTWEALEELLTCYLKVNDDNNHSYIIQAFSDLFIRRDQNTRRRSFTSPLSFTSSTAASPLPEEN